LRRSLIVKKIAFVTCMVVLTVALATPVMSQSAGKVRGWVSVIDAGAKSVTILPEGGTPVTVVMGDAESLSKVQEGDEAEARYTVKDGKNLGRFLRKIDGGCS
jgi:hypothetical protein